VWKVLYTDEDQQKFLKGHLDTAMIRYQNQTDNQEEILLLSGGILETFSPIFKHPAFEEEAEVRIVANVPIEANLETSFPLRYRESPRGNLIPYVEIEYPIDAITEIVVGPRSSSVEQEKAVDALEGYCAKLRKELGKEELDFRPNITTSRIPFTPP